MLRRNWMAGFLGGFVLLAGLGAPLAAWARNSSPLGLWRTIDDKTNKPRALVRITERNGMLYGTVAAVLDPIYADKHCVDCAGDRAGKPVVGLEIIRDLKPDGARWDGGTILNPEDGSVYHCRIHVGPDGETLIVRGFIGISMMGRSQMWQRMPE
jgi:uncharacterized protein (DUF2147 family)